MAIIVSKASVRPSFHPEVKAEVKWPNTKRNEWVPLWRCEKMIKQKRQAVINSLQKEVNESWELGGNDDPCNKMYVTKRGKRINLFCPKRLITVRAKNNDNTYHLNYESIDDKIKVFGDSYTQSSDFRKFGDFVLRIEQPLKL